MTICTLCVEIDATYSDPPIRIKLLGLRSSQGHPQFKNGTVYRQVRPTRLDEIKNFHLEVHVGAVEPTFLLTPQAAAHPCDSTSACSRTV